MDLHGHDQLTTSLTARCVRDAAIPTAQVAPPAPTVIPDFGDDQSLHAPSIATKTAVEVEPAGS